MSDSSPRIGYVSYSLFHAPFLASAYGTTVEGERERGENSPFLRQLPSALRTYEEAVGYPPNQAFIGNIDPRTLPPRPWARELEGGPDRTESGGAGSGTGAAGKESLAARAPMPENATGGFGSITDETTLFGLIKLADVFNLVSLTPEAAEAVRQRFSLFPALEGISTDFLNAPVSEADIGKEIETGALPLRTGSVLFGCVKAAHPSDPNMTAHVILENLCVKGTAIFALRNLFVRNGIDTASVDYIIETSEEACGDMNQRGGGNFAKAIGERAGCVNATGSDVRSFCAGPVHGILQASSLVKAGTFGRVAVVAGGALAKLGMNGKKHLEKGFPLLEDCLGGFALLVDGDAWEGLYPLIRYTGMHRIGAGSTPQAVISSLVADPLKRAGLSFDDIGYYAPEMHNPEITELGGAGNVTLSNLKMIAAMAVMEKQLERTEIDAFIEAHGSSGWAPTQGHIPSGIPALGWLLEWGRSGAVTRSLVIGKGSLFLGRMTNLFDGVSLIMEYRNAGKGGIGAAVAGQGATGTTAVTPGASSLPALSPAGSGLPESAKSGKVRLGLLVAGSERGEGEMRKGGEEAMKADPLLEIVFCRTGGTEDAAKTELDAAFASHSIDGAVAFHYPFPIGTATSAPCVYAGTGKKFILATTTGTSAADKVDALVMNAVQGVAAAKACGVSLPSVGFLNVDGARKAREIFGGLVERGYGAVLAESVRGEELLRGNDLLCGTADVIVADTLTGNIFIKLYGAAASGGTVEESGAGYGVGIGETDRIVGIVSRASSAGVVGRALLETARMARADILGIYAGEIDSARKAGLRSRREEIPASAVPNLAHSPVRTGASEKAPASARKKPVTREIAGIDIMSLEEAAERIAEAGIYCEAGMGCTGPVLLVAPEDETSAREQLSRLGYL